MRPIDSSALSPERRRSLLGRLDGASFDVVVIGGGVTGAATAMDLASRRRSVLLVERSDLASGTSSRSSKLIHGGLRYLEQFDFPLVREALKERGLLTSVLCPHLVRPQSFLYPLEHRGWERLYVGAGVGLYDTLAKLGGDRLPRHRHHSRSGAMDIFPSLRADQLAGAISYSDAQLDDARHTLMVARSAATFGAEILTSAEVTSVLGADSDRVSGVELTDRETGERYRVDAGAVVNATGVWAERTERLAGPNSINVRAAKGIHVVVDREAISGTGALITRAGKSVLFVLPWGDRWILGTTDTDWSYDLARPSVASTDVQYVLDHANRVLTTSLTTDDVISTYVGLRPLIAGVSASTAKLSREHAVATPVRGLVSVAGGKYTTYRVMGADAAAAAEVQLGHRPERSSTDRLPLLGATGWAELAADDRSVRDSFGVDHDGATRLLGRYGSAVDELAKVVATRPELKEPLTGGRGVLRAEVAYAASHEGALHLEDVLRRRTRLAFEAADRGLSAAPEAASIMAGVLGWSATEQDAELASYQAQIEAEHASESMGTDQEANAARTAPPEVRATVG